MVAIPIQTSVKKSLLLRLSSGCLFFAAAVAVSAQTTITPLDELAFGTFAAGNGGTVTIGTGGSGLLDDAGHQIVSVGATLHVAAAQRPGVYSGSFDITIDYQ